MILGKEWENTNEFMVVGEIVVFKKIAKGKWCGVEKQPYIVIETNLKYGEVDILVENIKTKEKVYTNTSALEPVKDKRVNIQLSLFEE